MKIAGEKLPDVNGNRYRMLALAVSRENHITLAESMSLTLVEAYLAIGAKFSEFR